MFPPVWLSGLLADAKDASENIKNLKSLMGIGWMRIWVSLYLFASCNTRLAS